MFRPPQSLIIAFIDEMRQQGYAVESVCRGSPGGQGCQIAARTYRAWKTRQPSARAVSDARVRQTIEELAFTTDARGRRRLTPEGLYGYRKMLIAVRGAGIPATPGAVDRAMRALGLNGFRRGHRVRTTIPAKNGKRAGDLLNRDFTAPPEPGVGDRFHLCADLGRIRLRGVHHRCVLPTHPRLACRDPQGPAPGRNPVADRVVGDAAVRVTRSRPGS